jgi:nucleotide-binding universal stress UspA family protein
MGTVVVGVDGSAGSELALRFAAREAKQRDARLRVVNAWHVPATANGNGFVLVYPIAPAEFEQGAKKTLEQSLEAVGDELAGLEVEQVVEQGQASEVLVEQAGGAELLVVGTRGHGGFVGLLLGSVSQQCAHHAHCPVAIVPPAEGDR